MLKSLVKRLIICFGLILPVISALNLAPYYAHALLLCTLHVLFTVLDDFLPIFASRQAKKLLMVLHLLFFIFFPKELLSGLFELGVQLFANGSMPSLALYSDLSLRFICLITAFVANLISKSEPTAALPTVIFVTGLLWGIKPMQSFNFYALSPLACLALFALREDEPFEITQKSRRERGLSLLFRLISMLIIALIALSLAPIRDMRNERLSKNAEEIKNKVNDAFFISGNRDAFSLRLLGWQPKGEEQLGGRPEPSAVPILKLKGSGTIYLKGTSLDYYTGSSWKDSFTAKRHRYSSEATAGIRAEILAEGFNGLTKKRQAEISLISEGTSTLFLPSRLISLDLSKMGMNAYFSDSSELFIARNLKTGDSYAFEFGQLLAGSEARVLRSGTATQKTGNKSIKIQLSQEQREKYCYVPELWHTNEGLNRFVKELTHGAADDFQRALNIRNELRKRYKYNLNVPEPNSDTDFVSQFLFETGEGYCTYFASAMTMLARKAGLPARFVGGFLAENLSGERLLTGENAHAWCEIYFDDLGWVIFDATPLDNQDADSDENSEDEQNDDKNNHNDKSNDEKNDNKNNENNDKKPSPSPENSRQGEDKGLNTKKPQSSPPPSDKNGEDKQNNQDNQSSQNNKNNENNENQNKGAKSTPKNNGSKLKILLILILLALLALIIYRYIATKPKNYARHFKDNEKKLNYFYTEHKKIYLVMGKKTPANATIIEGANDENAKKLFLPLCESLYGRRQISEASLYAVQSYISELERGVKKPLQKLRLALIRMLNIKI